MCGNATGETDELDRQVRVLAHPVRRAVVRHFAAEPTGTTLAGLAAAVADGLDGGEEFCERELRIALHHVHLPNLEAAGLVTYDDECRRIDSTIHEPEGGRVWRAVTAIDGVVTLIESEPRTETDGIDRELSAD